MHHDATSIANDLKYEAASGADQEAPCLVLDAECEMGEEEKDEDDEVDSVASKGGDVIEVGVFERTGSYCT